jgi:hypothetical protein
MNGEQREDDGGHSDTAGVNDQHGLVIKLVTSSAKTMEA